MGSSPGSTLDEEVARSRPNKGSTTATPGSRTHASGTPSREAAQVSLTLRQGSPFFFRPTAGAQPRESPHGRNDADEAQRPDVVISRPGVVAMNVIDRRDALSVIQKKSKNAKDCNARVPFTKLPDEIKKEKEKPGQRERVAPERPSHGAGTSSVVAQPPEPTNQDIYPGTGSPEETGRPAPQGPSSSTDGTVGVSESGGETRLRNAEGGADSVFPRRRGQRGLRWETQGIPPFPTGAAETPKGSYPPLSSWGRESSDKRSPPPKKKKVRRTRSRA